MTPGIYSDLSAEDYHADPNELPSLSSSIAGVLIKQSPAHAYARHPRLGGYPRKPTKDMDEGTLIHALLLGEQDRIVSIDAADFRTKAAKEQRDAATESGMIPVLAQKLVHAMRCADKIRARLAHFGYELDGESEVTLIWHEETDDGEQVTCKARVDHLKRDIGQLLDVKKTVSAHPDKCCRSFTDYSYEIQWAAYTSALRALMPEMAGRERMEYLFCELDHPFAVTPFAPAGTMQALGEMRWRRAVNTWAKCLREDNWPDYSANGVVYGEAPLYELRKEGLDEYTEV